MKKNVCKLVAMTMLVASVAPANLAGLAGSSAPFQIGRSTTELAGAANTPFMLQQGDRVFAGGDMVKVEGPSGHTVIVGENSLVEFVGDDALKLESGGLALAAPASEDVSVLVDQLQIKGVTDTATDATKSGNLVVGRLEENKIEVFSQGRRFVVNELPAGNQVAFLGLQDSITFVRNDVGRWTPMLPLSQIEGDPTQRQEDEEDRDEGVAAFFRRSLGGRTAAAAAGAAVLAGGIIWYTTQRDDDDNDDDDNQVFQGQPSSPVTPVPTPVDPVIEED